MKAIHIYAVVILKKGPLHVWCNAKSQLHQNRIANTVESQVNVGKVVMAIILQIALQISVKLHRISMNLL